MSTEEARKVSRQDIQLVQNLIEQCLQRYMTRKEVMNGLLVQEKIDPGFTELVWQKLEEENQEFFKAYHLRLMLKEQIMEFNKLLDRQVELMHHVGQAAVAFNGSHISPMHQNSACYIPENTGPVLKTENMHQPITTNITNGFTNGSLSMPSRMQTTVDVSPHSRRIDISPNMLLGQTSNVSIAQGMNVGMIKTEAGYPGSSGFIYGADGNVMEVHPEIGDASISSFSRVESNSHPLNETLMDAGTSAYGLLGHISQNFCLSDLTAEFSNGSDILDSYSRSPFLATDTNDFLDSHGRGENQGDDRRLGSISEGLNYDDFGSD